MNDKFEKVKLGCLILIVAVIAYTMLRPEETTSAILDDPDLRRHECFFNVDIEWHEDINSYTRQTIFNNLLKKLGFIYKKENIHFFKVDYFDFTTFSFLLREQCKTIKENATTQLKYTFLYSGGPHIYGGPIIGMQNSNVMYNVKISDNSEYISQLRTISVKNSWRKQFRMLNEEDTLEKCTVKLSFPVGEQEFIKIGEFSFSKADIYYSMYLDYAKSFFGFPIIINLPYENIYRNKRSDPSDDVGFSYIYIVYYKHCDKKLSLTNTLMDWADDLIGIPFNREGVNIDAQVDLKEMQKAIPSND